MTMFQAFNPTVEVNGQTVLAVANSLGLLKSMGIQVLSENGIEDPHPEEWYSQQAWLNAFRSISDNIGPSTLYQIGLSIPDNAEFPPEIDDIEKALSAIDIAYHMNHRLNGVPLFNPATGRMEEGIGHYYIKNWEGPKRKSRVKTRILAILIGVLWKPWPSGSSRPLRSLCMWPTMIPGGVAKTAVYGARM